MGPNPGRTDQATDWSSLIARQSFGCVARHVLVEQHSGEDSGSACLATVALHHGKRLTLVNLRDQLDAVPLPAICQWKGNHWVVLHGFQGSKVMICDPPLLSASSGATSFWRVGATV